MGLAAPLAACTPPWALPCRVTMLGLIEYRVSGGSPHGRWSKGDLEGAGWVRWPICWLGATPGLDLKWFGVLG